MKILVILNGDYGRRHANNIRKHAPPEWTLDVWEASRAYPLIMDYPEDFLPFALPEADLILDFAEHKSVAELLPDVARMTGAKAVIAAIDNEAALPRGLARQLRGWLERMNVNCVTPKPLCSLTGNHFWLSRRESVSYKDPLIAEFSCYFGRPDIRLTIDREKRTIANTVVCRDAVCGCAQYVADHLVGVLVDDAEQEAGMLHHHFPCWAAMGVDSDYGDTLMHISGNIMRDDIAEKVGPYRKIQYFSPGRRSDSAPSEKDEE